MNLPCHSPDLIFHRTQSPEVCEVHRLQASMLTEARIETKLSLGRLGCTSTDLSHRSVPGTANKFISRLYDNKHQHNTALVEITLRSRLNHHHFGSFVGIYDSLHGRRSHLGNCEVHLRHHHFHSFYGGTDWNIHLVINTLKYKRYEQKH